MRKEILFVFITLLLIAIQAKEFEFESFSKSLLTLHNNERIFRKLNKLTLDSDLSSKAMKLASEMINRKINDCEKDVGINEYWHKKKDSPLTPEMVFEDWLNEEVDIKKDDEPIAKIIWENTKLIGIGYATLNYETVIVVVYESDNKKDC